jgi:hypothetical protein
VGANGKMVKSPKGNEVLLRGIEYIGDQKRRDKDGKNVTIVDFEGIDYEIRDQSDLKELEKLLQKRVDDYEKEAEEAALKIVEIRDFDSREVFINS